MKRLLLAPLLLTLLFGCSSKNNDIIKLKCITNEFSQGLKVKTFEVPPKFSSFHMHVIKITIDKKTKKGFISAGTDKYPQKLNFEDVVISPDSIEFEQVSDFRGDTGEGILFTDKYTINRNSGEIIKKAKSTTSSSSSGYMLRGYCHVPDYPLF